MSKWESPSLDSGQQGRDCYSYFTDEEKRLRRQRVTGILVESNKFNFLFLLCNRTLVHPLKYTSTVFECVEVTCMPPCTAFHLSGIWARHLTCIRKEAELPHLWFIPCSLSSQISCDWCLLSHHYCLTSSCSNRISFVYPFQPHCSQQAPCAHSFFIRISVKIPPWKEAWCWCRTVPAVLKICLQYLLECSAWEFNNHVCKFWPPSPHSLPMYQILSGFADVRLSSRQHPLGSCCHWGYYKLEPAFPHRPGN